MIFKKYFTIISLLLFSVFSFFGCANIEFIRAIDSSNTIIDKLVINLDESKINKSGNELADVMNSIDSDMISFRNEIEKWKLQFASYPDLLQKLKLGIIVEVSKPLINQISIAIQFSDWQMFGLFYGYAEIEDENFEYSKAIQDVGPFIDKILAGEYSQENYGLFLIKYSILKNNGIIDDIKSFEFDGINYYNKYIELMNNRYGIDDVNVSQIFAYPDDRIYSNADNQEIEGDLTLLRWDFNDKDENFEMVIYKLTANSVWWYILAFVISVIFIGIMLFVIKRKNKGKTEEIITKRDIESNE